MTLVSLRINIGSGPHKTGGIEMLVLTCIEGKGRNKSKGYCRYVNPKRGEGT